MRGMSAAVVGLVFAATARVIVGSIRDGRSPLLAAAVFLLVGPLHVNTALVIALATPVGLWLYRPRCAS